MSAYYYIAIYLASAYYCISVRCPHTNLYLSYVYICSVGVSDRICPHTTMYLASAYYYISIRCPHTNLYTAIYLASAYYYISIRCPHTNFYLLSVYICSVGLSDLIYVSSYCYTHTTVYICPHTTM
jgi:hypothetical protein